MKSLKKTLKKPPPKTLKKAASSPPKKLLPKITGKKAARHPGCVMVAVDDAPDHPLFPKINPRMSFPGTYYIWDKGAKQVKQMTTVIPKTPTGTEPTNIGWSSCGNCHREFHLCKCLHGVQVPRSVEYIYDRVQAELADEEWTVHHENYKGSLSKGERERRKNTSSVSVSAREFTSTSSTPPKAITGDPAEDLAPRRATGKKTLQKPAQRLSKPTKTLPAPGKVSKAVRDDKTIDRKVLDNEVRDSNEKMLESLSNRLGKSTTGKKRLRKVSK